MSYNICFPWECVSCRCYFHLESALKPINAAKVYFEAANALRLHPDLSKIIIKIIRILLIMFGGSLSAMDGTAHENGECDLIRYADGVSNAIRSLCICHCNAIGWELASLNSP